MGLLGSHGWLGGWLMSDRVGGDRTVSQTFRNGLVMTVSGAVENLLREFLSRKLTSNVPAFANGKP